MNRSLPIAIPSKTYFGSTIFKCKAKKSSLKKILGIALVCMLYTFNCQAQFGANYSFAASTGTYTQISGGTTVTGLQYREAVSSAIPIGFSFNFDGVDYTSLYATSTGFLTFSTNSTYGSYNNLAAALNSRPLIAPLWDDMAGGAAGTAVYATTGTAGSRVFTFEWRNWAWNYSSGATISFQAKLYEGSNKIEFIYRRESGNTNSPSASIGLAGNGSGPGSFLSLNNGNTNATASSATSSNSISIRPATGQVFTFTRIAYPIDIEAAGLAAPGRGACIGPNKTVKITVKNSGSNVLDFSATPLTVNASVTGPTPATFPTVNIYSGTLAVNATQEVTVSTTYNMSKTGVYTFEATASVAGDMRLTNNTMAPATSTVTAAAALPQRVDFTGFGSTNLNTLWPNWQEASGVYPTGTTSTWSNRPGLGNPTANFAAVNLTGSYYKEWLVGPKFRATTATELHFKAAMTQYMSNSPVFFGQGMTGTDDKVQVMVSADCGATYNPVFTYDASNHTTLTHNFSDKVIPLSQFAGQEIIVAFFATAGDIDDMRSYDFRLDDIVIKNFGPNDVMPVRLATTKPGCLSAAEPVCVVVKNEGSAVQSNIPVSFRVGSGPGVNEVIPGPIQPGDTVQYCFTGTADLSAGGNHNLQVYTRLANDNTIENDTIARILTSLNGIITATNTARCGPGAVSLTATSPNPVATLNWYASASGGVPVSTGVTYNPTINNTTTYYVEAVPVTDIAGKPAPNPGSGQFTDGGLIFNTIQNIVLNTVQVFSDQATGGNLTITLKDANNNLLNSRTFTVPPVTGITAITVPLNFYVPMGNGYKLEQVGRSLIRDTPPSSGPAIFPIHSQLVSVTNGTNPGYYYYFYNWSVSAGCPSPRIPVTATVDPIPATPVITQTGSSLTSSAASGNQWYLNGNAIPGATGQSYVAIADGAYTVIVTANGCESATSNVLNVLIAGLSTELADMSILVYPNPNRGQFDLKIARLQRKAEVGLYSLTGKLIYHQEIAAAKKETLIPMNFENLASGVYLLKVVSEANVQVVKLVIE